MEEQAKGDPKATGDTKIPVECPKCGHKFTHFLGRVAKKIEHEAKVAGEGLGNAVGEVKFGGS